MTKKNTALHALRTLVPVILAVAALLGACAPGMTQDQIQALVQQSVAQTVAAQNSMGTAVAQTVEAISPSTPTSLPTLPVLNLPTLTPLATVTPFKISSGGGGGSGGSGAGAKYACDVWTRPFDNTEYKPGDPFDIKWVITNTGTATWEAGKDLEYYSGPLLTTATGVELPEMEPNDKYTFSADANAPLEKGFYVMTWKLEGGFCWPYVAIISGKPGDP
jgi:hypothetical protein